MANRIQLRRGTAAQWAAANPVLAQGEPGIETDTGKQKFGDGVSRWSVLAYASKGDRGPAGAADDTTMTEVASDPTSQFAAALSATIGDKIDMAISGLEVGSPVRTLTSAESPNELLARTLDFGRGSLRIAVASDSTWNDANDMMMKWAVRMGQITPAEFGVKQKFFDAATQQYKNWTSNKAGQETPASGGVVLTDNFNRNSTELVGSTTSGGQVWGGTAGSWTSDGALAHSPTATSAALSHNVGTPDAVVTATLDLTTATAGTGPQSRFFVGADNINVANGATDTIYAQLSISTAGIPNLKVYKRIGTVSTEIVTADFATGIDSNTATAQQVTITVQIQIQNVTVTLTPQGGATKTYAGTITESDYAELGGHVGVTFAINTGDYLRLGNFQAETPYNPATFNGVEIWNGAVAGSNLPYQQSRMELLYPAATPFDILIVSGGHNKGTATPEAFISEVDAFIAAFRAAHPETLILVSSQNPQFAPAPYIAAHAARQAAWRAYAMEKGYEYLPVFEAFAAQADGGASLVNTDGIHPTYPGMPNATAGIWNLDWSGSVLWAAVWMEAIKARRISAQPPLTTIP